MGDFYLLKKRTNRGGEEEGVVPRRLFRVTLYLKDFLTFSNHFSRSSIAMVKWLLVVTSVLACLTFVAAKTNTEEEEKMEPRLGFATVSSDGTTSITFNATTIQNAVILSLFILVLGLLILPLFGIDLGGLFGSARSDTLPQTNYDSQLYNYGYDYSKR